jgi:HEAT repeat protein
LRAIRTGNAIERRVAARDLSVPRRKIDAEEAMAALFATLGDEDATVRATAADSIGVVVYLLRHHAATVPVASGLLKRQIDVATRALVRVLSDRDSGVRAAAATGLGTMAKSPIPGPPTPKQLAALKDESNAVRRQAAKLLYGSPDVKLPPELTAALKDESAEVRAAAARALARFGPDLGPEIPALFAMLERDETDVQSACREALEATWPSPAFVPALVEHLRSGDRWGRAYAAKLSGRIGAEAKEMIPALIAVLNERFDLDQRDPSDAVVSPGFPAFCAARALGQMGPSREAIAALVDVITPEKLEHVKASSRRRAEQDEGALALRRLGKIRPPTDPVLSGEFARIAVAVQSLGEIGSPAAAAVPALITAYNNGWSLSQMAIPVALGRIAPNSPAAPEAVAALIRGLDARDHFDRLGAVEALGQFGADAAAAIPKLQALQNDSNRSIRDAATKSLAAVEAQSKADVGGGRGRPRP